MEHHLDDHIITLFGEKLHELEKSEATISKYLRDVNTFRRWLGEEDLVDKNRVILYKQALKEKYKLTSANSMLSAINTFFKIMDWGECRVMTFKVQRTTFRSGEKELTVEEYRRLLQAAKDKRKGMLWMIMQTIAGTGIRISELPFITVESLNTRRAQVSLKGKTREVLIPAELCRKLRAYCRERNITSGSIFVTRNGNSINRSDVLHRMKALSESAGVDRGKIFPHNLRHLFAVTYYETEKDIVRLADLLGHVNINTTRIYTLISCETQLSMLDKVGTTLLAD